MRKNSPPTRGALVRTAAALVLAVRGHDILEQKRHVLMMELSRRWQTAQMGPFVVGYPGVEGAFSHIAASRIFAGQPVHAYVTFAEVFDAVQSCAVAAGVVPFENSYTGEVGEVLDRERRRCAHRFEARDVERGPGGRTR